MMKNDISIIILAAGKGTRMNSEKAKVLHPLIDRPMILHVVGTAAQIVEENDIIMVTGHQSESVREIVSEKINTRFALQKEQNGTGHAVQCALPELPDRCKMVVILSGDVPMIKSETIQAMIASHEKEACDISVLGVHLTHPFGYGRIVVNSSGRVEKIVEESDADDDEKKINIVNTGIYCVNRDFLEDALSEIRSENVQNEIYLTDIVAVAHRDHKIVGLEVCNDSTEVMGINSLQDLINMESLLACK